MTALKPRALRSGDTIGVVSPASPIEPAKLEAGLRVLIDAGFRIKLGKSVHAADGHLAGTDQARSQDLQEAFDDPDVQAVFCSRGGYGCARLLPHLDLDRMAQSRKLFSGFSDITSIHLALNRRGLATLHAPMALSLAFDRPEWVIQSLLAALRGENPIPPTAPRGTTLVSGTADGIVTGGCLCLLTDSIGTPNTLDFRDKIVLIEDVDEAPHRVDAMLTHLLHSGNLQQAAGIVFGEMTNTNDKVDAGIGGKPWEEIVGERVSPLGIPTMTNFPFGHVRGMLSLPLGIRARMDADAGTLTYLEPLCET